MNTSDFPEFDDKWIGYGILVLMTFIMYAWVTSSASPLPNFPHRNDVATLVSHLEVLLFVVIPFVLMGLIHSLDPKSYLNRASNRATSAASRLNQRAINYRKTHSTKLKYKKDLPK